MVLWRLQPAGANRAWTAVNREPAGGGHQAITGPARASCHMPENPPTMLTARANQCWPRMRAFRFSSRGKVAACQTLASGISTLVTKRDPPRRCFGSGNSELAEVESKEPKSHTKSVKCKLEQCRLRASNPLAFSIWRFLLAASEPQRRIFHKFHRREL